MGELISYIVKADRKVTARELNSVFGLDKDDNGGWPVVRSTLKNEIRGCAVCIGADTGGYFVIKTTIQLKDYILNLNARIAGIEERISLALGNFSL